MVESLIGHVEAGSCSLWRPVRRECNAWPLVLSLHIMCMIQRSQRIISLTRLTPQDHAVAGLGAGTVATLVMHPLDLVKVRFQLAETPPGSSRGTILSATPTPAASGSPLPYHSISALASNGSSSSVLGPSTSTSRILPSSSYPRSSLSPPFSSLAKGKAPVRPPRLGTGVYRALEEAVIADGWKGLYRGLMPNLLGGASSWGLYFLL